MKISELEYVKVPLQGRKNIPNHSIYLIWALEEIKIRKMNTIGMTHEEEKFASRNAENKKVAHVNYIKMKSGSGG